MNTKIIGMWSFFIGLVLAMATVFVDLGDWAAQVLIVLGLLAGGFHIVREDLVILGVSYLALAAVSETAGELVAIGPYISDIAGAWVGFLGPVVLIAFMIWGAPLLMVKKDS